MFKIALSCFCLKIWYGTLYTGQMKKEFECLRTKNSSSARPEVERSIFRETDQTAANWAVIGLMLLRSIFKSQREPSESLWSGEYGCNILRATVPLHPFKLLLRLMRFDDRKAREKRRSWDRFAPIRALFEKLNKHFQENYTLSEHVTIDETLRKFRGHCKVSLYMHPKPGKYVILFRVLADAKAP